MTAYGSMSERSDKEVKISMKNSLSMLRKVTNHPYMIEYPLEEDGNHYRIDEELVESCGKLKVLDQVCSSSNADFILQTLEWIVLEHNTTPNGAFVPPNWLITN